MKLDPTKADYAKLAAALTKLESLPSQRRFHPETVKALKAGKLEDWDLYELVAHDYDSELAGREDLRPVWERSRALLAVIAEMDALGLACDKTAAVRRALEGWKLE